MTSYILSIYISPIVFSTCNTLLTTANMSQAIYIFRSTHCPISVNTKTLRCTQQTFKKMER